ncbi:hypothetical protein K461DRAFT_257013 [Myriangium duriaei CBS 260.36]|uniref:NACHT domain-containing protein n=1 Tax=Myriangium duriaei CBS 260.36 TaxID=1168546 RepID=A0A9P4IZM1_9PEZI|nr:hypothetical protein K461DRAFT_257013 [Myriangium duriaei CBS 260.36]
MSNGLSSPAESRFFTPKKPGLPTRLSSSRISSQYNSHYSSYKLNIVADTTTSLKRKSAAELGARVAGSIANTGFPEFVEWIHTERLSSLPHRGSRWDKVLIRAAYVAEQIQSFDLAIQDFAVDSTTSAEITFGFLRLLLELGFENSKALDRVFAFLYKNALQVSLLLTRPELLTNSTPQIKEQLCFLYADLVTLVVDVSVRLYKTVNGMTSGSASLDLYHVFGSTIDALEQRRDTIVHEIWRCRFQQEGYDEEEKVGQIDLLSRWLSPADQVLASLTKDFSTFTDDQAELTCMWFQKALQKFCLGTDKTMLLTGKPGCGKTVLSASIAERLQRSVNRKNFSVIFSSISTAMPTVATSINVAKSILYQLLNLHSGDLHLFRTLLAAHERARVAATNNDYESHLWTAIASVLREPLHKTQELVLVIDGIDEISSDDPKAGQRLFEQLYHVVNESKSVKLIVLSQDSKISANHYGFHREISADDIRDDLFAVAQRTLLINDGFKDVPEAIQDSIVHRLVTLANGSFIWLNLACEVLLLEKAKTSTSITKIVEDMEKARTPLQVQDLCGRILSASSPGQDGLTILNWLLESERPFTTEELRALFSIDHQHNKIQNRNVDIQGCVKTLRPFLTINGHIVRIKHPQIMVAARNLVRTGKLPVPVGDAETDLLYRTLSYAKAVLTDHKEPTLGELEIVHANRYFNQNTLLSYVVRYWPRHLEQCRLHNKAKNEFEITPDLKRVFPETALLPLLEIRCWEDLPPQMVLEQFIFTSRIRKQVLREDSISVLQTYIAIAYYYSLLGRRSEAAKYYWLTTKLGLIVLGESHDLIVEVGHRFLAIIETITITSRTEIATYKEETLQTMIKCLTKTYGASSEQVIEIQKTLASFYTAIHEEEHAEEILRIIRVSTDLVFEEENARRLPDHLQIDVRKRRPTEGSGSSGWSIEEPDEDLVLEFSFSQIEVLIKRAFHFHGCGQLIQAERTFIEVWEHVSRTCRTTHAIEWHEKNIEIATHYSKFLRSVKREIECVAILNTVWEQYEHSELRFSEVIVEKFTAIAKTLQTMGYHAMSLSIYQYAYSYFKSTSVKTTEHHTSLKEIEERISTTSTEVLKETTTSTTVTTTSSSSSSSSATSVFRSLITNTSKTVDTTTITLAKKLSFEFFEQQEYHQAMSVIELTLKRTWSSFFSEALESISLATSFTEESIELVIKLAECHLQLRQLVQVEDVYLRLFRSILLAKSVHTAWLDRAKFLLISFYDRHGYASKAISIFQEILIVQRRTLGPSHKLTIETLYILGSRCRSHARSHLYWVEYYQAIITELTTKDNLCHVDALEAYIIVSTVYWEDRRYAEAISLYSVLWNTFKLKVKEYKKFSDTKFVQTLYQRYVQCLEETKTELELIHQITTEYRETCIKAYGAKAEITIEATIQLAKVCQRSEKYEHESISLYEEASSSSTSTTTVTQVKESLRSLYSKQITSKSSSTFSSSTIERALKIQEERYAEVKSKHEYSSYATLSSLRELSILHYKQKKVESMFKEISHVVEQITIKETSSQKLIESATYIAETFQIIEQVRTCHELVEELHLQIIAKHRRESKFSFNLTSCTRSSLVFLAQLEFTLRRSHDLRLTFSEVMVDLISEAFQYDTLRRLITAKAPFEEIATCAAPFYAFLSRKKRQYIIRIVEHDIFKCFEGAHLGKHKLISKDSPQRFIVAILQYLSRKKSSNFVRSVLIASVDEVEHLLKERRWAEAHDVASIAFRYVKAHDGFDGATRITQGFRLALLLSGRSGTRCDNPEISKQLVQLSKNVIHDVLEVCKEKKINLAHVNLAELNQLISLLGEVEDYHTLEWLLTSLWQTRDTQRSWPVPVKVMLGRRLICARFLAGCTVKALRLAEDIAYNTKKVHGARSSHALGMYELLAQLYASIAQQYQQKAASGDKNAAAMAQTHFRKALGVEEDLLKYMIYEGTADDSDDEEYDTVSAIHSHYGSDRGSVNGVGNGVSSHMNGNGHHHEAEAPVDKDAFVKKHLRLLKLAYQRNGGWPREGSKEYTKLNADAFGRFGQALKGESGVEKWSADGFGGGKAESQDGVFVKTGQWELAKPEEVQRVQQLILRTL